MIGDKLVVLTALVIVIVLLLILTIAVLHLVKVIKR